MITPDIRTLPGFSPAMGADERIALVQAYIAGETEPVKVGDPARITYGYPLAAVVTRVTAKTITIARVETGPARPDTACDVGAHGARPMVSDGILDKIIPGTERRFSFTRGAWRNGETIARLGASYTWIDYRP